MLDMKDRKILDLLQKDSRMLLKDIAKSVNLSIDATHKRMKKMKEAKIYYPTILIDPKKIGYPLVVDAKIKLKDIDKKRYNEFIAYLCELPQAIAVFSVSGDYDISLPLMAKDHNQLEELKLTIRENFKDIIADWREVVNLKFFKYEEYYMQRL
ncbi:Lrp/AsnC family transcriptional regulator [Nanoarchaeota archaeon]